MYSHILKSNILSLLPLKRSMGSLARKTSTGLLWAGISVLLKGETLMENVLLFLCHKEKRGILKLSAGIYYFSLIKGREPICVSILVAGSPIVIRTHSAYTLSKIGSNTAL